MKYQLTLPNKQKLIFKTLREGFVAITSKWYYDKFPYRWRIDEYGNNVIQDDFLLDYNLRKDAFIEKHTDELQEIGQSVTLDDLTLTVVDDLSHNFSSTLM